MLESACKCKLDSEVLYSNADVVKDSIGSAAPHHVDTAASGASSAAADIVEIPGTEGLPSLTWTSQLRRVIALLMHAMHHREPVLLVGETGTGKTSAVQLVALIK